MPMIHFNRIYKRIQVSNIELKIVRLRKYQFNDCFFFRNEEKLLYHSNPFAYHWYVVLNCSQFCIRISETNVICQVEKTGTFLSWSRFVLKLVIVSSFFSDVISNSCNKTILLANTGKLGKINFEISKSHYSWPGDHCFFLFSLSHHFLALTRWYDIACRCVSLHQKSVFRALHASFVSKRQFQSSFNNNKNEWQRFVNIRMSCAARCATYFILSLC